MSYTDILRTYNFTNLPNNAISPTESGIYEIGYTLLAKTDVPSIGPLGLIWRALQATV